MLVWFSVPRPKARLQLRSQIHTTHDKQSRLISDKLAKLCEASATVRGRPQFKSQTPLTSCDLGQMKPSERPFLTHRVVIIIISFAWCLWKLNEALCVNMSWCLSSV